MKYLILSVLGLAALVAFGARDDGALTAFSSFQSGGYPVSGRYLVTQYDDNGDLTHQGEEVFEIGSKDAFAKLLSGMLAPDCEDRQLDLSDGEFALNASCQTSEGSIRGIPVNAWGTYETDAFAVHAEMLVYGIKSGGHTEFSLIDLN